VLASYHAAMAHRVVNLLERLGMEPEFAITGGISKNVGIVKRITDELGVTPLDTEYDAQIAGAIGAALFARELAMMERKRRKS
jgi:benzoyl-CoA reductase subunit A